MMPGMGKVFQIYSSFLFNIIINYFTFDNISLLLQATQFVKILHVAFFCLFFVTFFLSVLLFHLLLWNIFITFWHSQNFQ